MMVIGGGMLAPLLKPIGGWIPLPCWGEGMNGGSEPAGGL